MIDYSLDQETVDWARGKVEAVITWCREQEIRLRGKGDEEHAMRYRFAANVMEMKLTSSGCVISPFSERGPEVRHQIKAALGHSGGTDG